jgi:YggT family protein
MGGIVPIVATVLYVALLIYFLLLLARFGFDLAMALRRDFRPHGFGLVVAEVAYASTDPPLKLLRRIIPPFRIGGAKIDFAWSLLVLIVIILMTIVSLGFVN